MQETTFFLLRFPAENIQSHRSNTGLISFSVSIGEKRELDDELILATAPCSDLFGFGHVFDELMRFASCGKSLYVKECDIHVPLWF